MEDNNRDLELGDTLVGTKFQSTNLSKHYHDNPFKLVKYIPLKDSDIPMNYHLGLVNQKKGIKEEFEDFFGQKEERWNNKKMITKSNFFVRFLIKETDAKLADLEYGIVKP